MSNVLLKKDFDYKNSHVEKLSSEYLTVPDVNMSIKEILRRQMAGLPLPEGVVNPVQYSNAFLPAYARKGFDLADVKSVMRAGDDAAQEIKEYVINDLKKQNAESSSTVVS
nr:hypothetical protein OIUHVQDI_OIUHVQDI_CDS_0003 [Microvirus sp.]